MLLQLFIVLCLFKQVSFTCNLSALMKACVMKHAGKMKSIIMLVSSTFWLFWLLHSVSVAGITLKYMYYLPLSLHTYISIKNRVKIVCLIARVGNSHKKTFFSQETLTKIISEKKKNIYIIVYCGLFKPAWFPRPEVSEVWTRHSRIYLNGGWPVYNGRFSLNLWTGFNHFFSHPTTEIKPEAIKINISMSDLWFTSTRSLHNLTCSEICFPWKIYCCWTLSWSDWTLHI